MYFHSLLVAALAAISLASPIKQKRVKNFKYFGVNQSGGEWGLNSIPGTSGKDYLWPNTSSIDILIGKGLNTFRIPFIMERINATAITGPADQYYLAPLTDIVNHITASSAYATLVAQNFGRYNNQIITNTSSFQTFWKNLATHFKDNDKVLFDTNNEYHDMNPNLAIATKLVFDLNQAAINGIRAAGATTQSILIEGNSYTSALYWNDTGAGNNDDLKSLKDPSNKLIYEMHQYFDGDDAGQYFGGSGTHPSCWNETVGSDALKGATNWLRTNNKKGLLGEFAAGSNPTCLKTVENMLAYMKANCDVWQGALMWGGGRVWDDWPNPNDPVQYPGKPPRYIFGMEPKLGTAYLGVLPTVLKYI
ncbi:MAG: hypothetical protein M1812_007165 [Candelaria pacifica]|nr:MAG: hypothetical protein M1812_007165 [Candelaria pacifica]